MSSSFSRRQSRARAKRSRQQVFELKFYDLRALIGVLQPDRPMTGEVVAVVKALAAIRQGNKLCMCCDAPLGRWPGSVMVCTPFAAPPEQAMVGGICGQCEALGPEYVQERCIATFRAGGLYNARTIKAGAA
jgi:hypothetical protein